MLGTGLDTREVVTSPISCGGSESLGKCLSPYGDRVEVLLPEQANGIGSTIDDQGKHIDDIAAEDAHVEGFRVDETGKLACEYRFAIFIVGEADFRFDHNRIRSREGFARRP